MIGVVSSKYIGSFDKAPHNEADLLRHTYGMTLTDRTRHYQGERKNTAWGYSFDTNHRYPIHMTIDARQTRLHFESAWGRTSGAAFKGYIPLPNLADDEYWIPIAGFEYSGNKCTISFA